MADEAPLHCRGLSFEANLINEVPVYAKASADKPVHRKRLAHRSSEWK